MTEKEKDKRLQAWFALQRRKEIGEHEGHTYSEGHPEPHHCSQHCGCLNYEAKK